MSYFAKKILIIGLGVSGRSAAAFLLKQGANIWGVDRDQNLLNQHEEIKQLRLKGLHTCLEDEEIAIKFFDLIVVSPGVPPTNPHYSAAKRAGLKIIGEMELACRHIQNPSLAITGSNGKTTTTLLTTHVLNESGYRASAWGNIGIPLLCALDRQLTEILLVEMSSWQLETIETALFDAGAILNITPNHLDRHGSMENYVKAKMRLKNCLKPHALLYVGNQVFEQFPNFFKDYPVKTFGFESSCNIYSDGFYIYNEGIKVFPVPEQYVGRPTHDVENILASFALSQTKAVTGEQFLSAFATFVKPPHRMEFVKKIAGVAYYNDSKGTSLDAVQKAVTSLQGPTHLIAGGVHKGASYSLWQKSFAGRVRCIYAIGQAAEQIQKDLQGSIPIEQCQNLETALKNAARNAKEGENVLLSPGCASYDMFKDYNHRGDEFKRLVQELGIKE